MTSARQALDRLAEALIDDILAMSDKEILQEFQEDHGDSERHAAEMRHIVQTAIAHADPQPPEARMHPSHNDPMPAYPKHCPVCGATVHPLHHAPSDAVQRERKQHLVPASAWVWEWTARCWNGHLVAPLPEQMRLV